MPLASKMAMPVGLMPRRVMQMDELQIQACPHDHLCECLPAQPPVMLRVAQHLKQMASLPQVRMLPCDAVSAGTTELQPLRPTYSLHPPQG